MTLRNLIGAIATTARTQAEEIAGVAGFGAIITGVWGLWGWEWALIAAGLPVAGFYLWGQIRIVTAGERPEGVE